MPVFSQETSIIKGTREAEGVKSLKEEHHVTLGFLLVHQSVHLKEEKNIHLILHLTGQRIGNEPSIFVPIFMFAGVFLGIWKVGQTHNT